MQKIFGICAVDEKFGFGYKNSLPWKCAHDLKFFSTQTNDSIVIMGHNTWKSIPQQIFLKNKINIVISKTPHTEHEKNVFYFSNFKKALGYAKTLNKNIFIIGGTQLLTYALQNNFITDMYVTFITGEYECDVYFKQLETHLQNFQKRETIATYNDCIIQLYSHLHFN